MSITWLNQLSEAHKKLLTADHAYPFLQFAYLHALEQSGSVGPQTGWWPQHALIESPSGQSIFLPHYLKSHSMGEYVFDHSWAEAYQRHGLAYYPKLINAIPFTPCQGPRSSDGELAHYLPNIIAHCQQQQLSSWHGLFAHTDFADCLEKIPELLQRTSYQFHWFNRNSQQQPYADFAEFLNEMRSKARKNILQERRKVVDQNLRIERIAGPDISAQHWQQFYQFYAMTYLQRGHRPHLTPQFFELLGKNLGQQLHLQWVTHQGEAVAAALFFEDQTTLYGRYWGCTQQFDALHFETCYYRGIEYCIAKGLQRFDPGTQGEHKITRGFQPVATPSLHWIAHPQFRAAIADFLTQEAQALKLYRQQCVEKLPFRIIEGPSSAAWPPLRWHEID
jgi:hypothetical protein